MVNRVTTALTPLSTAAQPLVDFIKIIRDVALIVLGLGAFCVVLAIATVVIIAPVTVIGMRLSGLFADRLASILSRIFKWGPPQISSDDIPKLPKKITILCKSDPFKKEYNRATDLGDVVGFATLLTAPSDSTHPLDIDRIFVNICRYLSPANATRFAKTSKRCYVLYQANSDDVHPHAYFNSRFNCSVQEQLFKTTRAFDQYMLYAHLCNRFCGHPLGYPRHLPYAKPPIGKNLIRHLIEKIGPFTFLSIPYVDNFDTPMDEKNPIERTASRWYDLERGYLQAMHLRLRMKIRGITLIQEIHENNNYWIFNTDRTLIARRNTGLWKSDVSLSENDVAFLCLLLQEPTGVDLDIEKFLINRTYKNTLNPNNLPKVTLHATLEPPLSALGPPNGGI